MNNSTLHILGIETSCDETAAAVVCNATDYLDRIKSNVIHTQIEEHQQYGGVVPELAARAHLKNIYPVITTALNNASCTLNDIDAIAVTAGPGLIGGVLVGATVAKTIAMTLKKTIIAVNHLEGHALTIRLTHNIPYPYVLLLASGGHCQFIAVEAFKKYKILGRTLDDSAGEAFDKVAKMMGLSYPGGPILEKMAKNGNPIYINRLPRPLKGRHDGMMSFSGLKTAMRILIEELQPLSHQIISDLAASFQHITADHLTSKLKYVLEQLPPEYKHVVVAGGVAANQFICAALKDVSHAHKKKFDSPPIHLCTDNAAMIAWAGIEHYNNNCFDSLNFKIRPRWPLESL